MTSEQIARIAHEVNRAYCHSIGDDSQLPWRAAPEWQRLSAISGVEAHLREDLTPEQSHERWLDHKAREGWSYDPIKDEAKKQHPCFVTYTALPREQQTKDHLFRAVVHACKAGGTA